jgi:putative Holliday junction resolvase
MPAAHAIPHPNHSCDGAAADLVPDLEAIGVLLRWRGLHYLRFRSRRKPVWRTSASAPIIRIRPAEHKPIRPRRRYGGTARDLGRSVPDVLDQRLGMRALALDVGARTIGLALSDEDGNFARAWGVLARKGQRTDAREVVERARRENVGHVVVGLPLELDGREGSRARAVRRFVDVLADELAASAAEVEIATWDERFSTAAAERTLLEADVSRARRKQAIDALAAQFILQGWLDSRRGREVDA